MGKLVAYSGLTTKIRAMKSNLISDAQFEEIAGLNSIPELISYLERFPAYSELFKDADASKVHRGELEWRLNFSTYYDYTKLYSFAKNEQRNFMELYFTKFEIFSLKRYIRNILDIREENRLPYMANHFELHSNLKTEKLASSADMEEFVEHLKGTIYYVSLSKVNALQKPILFDYELALDQFYFSYVWKQKDKLFKDDELKHITNSVGSKIDLLNIMWAFRCKTYYNLTNAQIYSYLIPIYYRLTPADIKTMVETKDMKVFFSVFKSTDYAKKLAKNKIKRIDEMYNYAMMRMHMDDFKNNPYSLAAIDAYFYLKELEVSRITTAAECIRYGYPAAKTYDYIMGKGIS